MGTREQTDFDAVVGINEWNEIVICNYVFDNGDGFKGAVGSKLVPVDQDYIEYRNEVEYLISEYKCLWLEAVDEGTTELSLREYMEDLSASAGWVCDGEFVGQDTSYIHLVSAEIKEEYFPEAVTFECIGAGRQFNKHMIFKKVFRQDILDLIVGMEEHFTYEVEDENV